LFAAAVFFIKKKLISHDLECCSYQIQKEIKAEQESVVEQALTVARIEWDRERLEMKEAFENE